MTKAGASLFYFGIYVLLVGLLFLTIPQQLLSLLNLPPMQSGWARVIGLLALIIGTCDILCGRANIAVIINASVYIRLGFVAGLVLLVIFRQMPITTILFGAVDLAGAIWTAAASKAEKKPQASFSTPL